MHYLCDQHRTIIVRILTRSQCLWEGGEPGLEDAGQPGPASWALFPPNVCAPRLSPADAGGWESKFLHFQPLIWSTCCSSRMDRFPSIGRGSDAGWPACLTNGNSITETLDSWALRSEESSFAFAYMAVVMLLPSGMIRKKCHVILSSLL